MGCSCSDALTVQHLQLKQTGCDLQRQQPNAGPPVGLVLVRRFKTVRFVLVLNALAAVVVMVVVAGVVVAVIAILVGDCCSCCFRWRVAVAVVVVVVVVVAAAAAAAAVLLVRSSFVWQSVYRMQHRAPQNSKA